MTDRKHRTRVLAVVLAGGEGTRLGVLTKGRAKPALPFGGSYRLVDFTLSNCVHSGLSDVWVVEQYESHTLNDHLASGRPWDLDRTRGGLQVLPPALTGDAPGGGEGGFTRGNADALYRNLHLLREFDPDVLLVLSADHVVLMDYAEVLDAHAATGAGVTLVTVKVPQGESATRFGNVRVAEDGRVTDFRYKPDEPISDVVTTEVFAYDAPQLFVALEEIAAEQNGNLKDFGHELIPRFVGSGRAFAFAFDGYWRDVGTPDAYWQAHADLLEGRVGRLDDPSWPVLSSGLARQPSRFAQTARLEDSMIASGCDVRGEVVRSVLAPGVVVEAGATVRDSVLLQDVHVKAGARVERAVLDERVVVARDARVGGPGGVTVVGAGAQLTAGSVLRAGESVEPGVRPELRSV